MELWLAGLIVLAFVGTLIGVLVALTHFDRVRGARALERIRADEARWKREEERRRDMLRDAARKRLYDDPNLPARSDPSPPNRRRNEAPVYSIWEEPMACPASPTPSRRDLDELTDRSPGRFETGGGFGGAAAVATFATGGGFGGEPDRFSSGGGFDSSSSSSSSDSSSSSSSSGSSD